jgi:hypothetical protein
MITPVPHTSKGKTITADWARRVESHLFIRDRDPKFPNTPGAMSPGGGAFLARVVGIYDSLDGQAWPAGGIPYKMQRIGMKSGASSSPVALLDTQDDLSLGDSYQFAAFSIAEISGGSASFVDDVVCVFPMLCPVPGDTTNTPTAVYFFFPSVDEIECRLTENTLISGQELAWTYTAQPQKTAATSTTWPPMIDNDLDTITPCYNSIEFPNPATMAGPGMTGIGVSLPLSSGTGTMQPIGVGAVVKMRKFAAQDQSIFYVFEGYNSITC